jgi:hypothetical protein
MPTITLRGYNGPTLNKIDLIRVFQRDGGMSLADAHDATCRTVDDKPVVIHFASNEGARRFAAELKRLNVDYHVTGKLDPGQLHDTSDPSEPLLKYPNLIPPGETDVVCYGGPFDRTGHYVPEEWDSFSLALHGWAYHYVQGVRQDCLEDRMRVFHFVAREEIKEEGETPES